MPFPLSVIVIARNEEEDLKACLESVRGTAEEIILVDDYSQDKTVQVAEQHHARVLRHRFESYAAQKQYALEQATGEWALNLDADERLSPELAREIRDVIARKPADGESVNGFYIPFEVHFMGRAMRHTGLGKEKHLRLFRRRSSRFSGGLLHEGIAVPPPLGKLRHKIIHRPYKDMTEYFEKLERYTSLGAQKAHREGRRFRWYHYGIYPAEFFKRYVLQMGFLDGSAGWTWSRLSALHHWTKYKKLRDMASSGSPRLSPAGEPEDMGHLAKPPALLHACESADGGQGQAVASKHKSP